jgi:tetratricopeptide (TPR) repeat protein
MTCTHCNSENSDDSLFCKACGRRLFVKKLISEQIVDVEKLLNDGYFALDAGRTGEALLVVEGILRLDPTNGSAWSLKALVHERSGERDEAIDAYEQVVALNPDSSQDRRRLMELRSAGSAAAANRSKFRGPSPLLAGMLTVVVLLVFMLGMAAWVMNAQAVKKMADSSQVNGTPAQNPTAANPNRTAVPPTANFNNQPSAQPPASNTQPVHRSDQDKSLSPVFPLDTSNFSGTAATAQPKGTTKTDNGSVVLPTSTTASSGNNSAKKPDEPKSIIDVHVSDGQPAKTAAGPSVDQQSLSLLKIARTQQQQGDYRTAIKSYERALGGARFKGYIYQSIGLCYDRLRDAGNATQAYRNAIDQYSRQIADGYDVNGARAGVEVCRSWLKAQGA